MQGRNLKVGIFTCRSDYLLTGKVIEKDFRKSKALSDTSNSINTVTT